MTFEFHPGFEDDIRALPDRATQVAAAQAIADLRAGTRHGAELGWHPSIGDLRDCRKVLFDAPGRQDKPRYRIVYRVIEQIEVGEPPRMEVVSAEMVSAGEREELRAYALAAQRLGR